ncbi:hypothetical protein [Dietzia cercidiphylli]|uniref:hypothetical protein n=1 Tax=Dietzia cercidiphylli TaxID=498199 RepID=UPI00223B8332|nr:hypothetical protein [Dietzia cercidiphylli]MCT1515306.1 hypothetical protein [Dietzia cercidiphylli]
MTVSVAKHGQQSGVWSTVEDVPTRLRTDHPRSQERSTIMATRSALPRTHSSATSTIQTTRSHIGAATDSPSKLGTAEAPLAPRNRADSCGWYLIEDPDSGQQGAVRRRRREMGWFPDPAAAQPTTYRQHVDLGDVAEHIEALLAAGFTVAQLADQAAATPEEIRSLRADVAEVSDTVTAEAVARIGFAPGRGDDLAPRLGAHRRIQGLRAMGYPLEILASELGMSRWELTKLGTHGTMCADLWRSIDELYDRWAMTPGPSESVRRQARAAGAVPPLGWDDDEIDDPRARSHADDVGEPIPPKAEFDCTAIARRLDGDLSVPLTPAEYAEVVRTAIVEHWPIERLAQVLGVKVASARRALRRWKAVAAEDVSEQGALGAGEVDHQVDPDTEPTGQELAAIEAEDRGREEFVDDLGSGVGRAERWDQLENLMRRRSARRSSRRPRGRSSPGRASSGRASCTDPPVGVQLELLERAQCA